ncbi:MAG: nucleoside triphosphate pyrophosphohydrolase [Candidatus Tectomicrobia bacterium]|uniref:Nucleoside triphosphate pyrophosphohydrolase n=1 Tax=Tectimicrobiota bacterium TaxID=2528274 RepID=A0A932CQ75_UNCTE|nr:nucleoside triphosphate pyrophosphohydrolase [Candidatus Tectomicrobia bacterium]
MEGKKASSFERLLAIMATLRSEGGCPWDREQTRQSLKPYLIEEAYEAVEALDQGDPEKIKEELGDVLLQVVFHARISQELEEFDIEDILQALVQKMIRRHAHVFGPQKAANSQEALTRWEAIKRGEKRHLPRHSALDGVPLHLPALLQAQRLQEKASRVGFDWTEVSPVLEKVEEEWREFRQADAQGDRSEMEKELGDLLFSLVNLARFLELNAEESLRKASQRFTQRFHYLEQRLKEAGKGWEETSLAEMDALWEEAKESAELKAQGKDKPRTLSHERQGDG